MGFTFSYEERRLIMSKNILFLTEETFKSRTGASNNIDGKQIFPMVKVAGDMHIQPALGSKLYNRLQEGINADNLSPNEIYLINNYITDTLIWYTMSLLPMIMGFQLFSKGFLQKQSEESKEPSRADLELIEQKYLSLAEFYKTRLIKYLQQNYSLFNEYFNTQLDIDTIFPENKAYTSPIYLGSDFERPLPYYNSSSTTSAPMVVYYTAIGGETTFVVIPLIGRTCILAFRSGLQKLITLTPTSDTGYIQINNGTIKLATGDVAQANELFTFEYR